MATKEQRVELEIPVITTGTLTICIVGRQPFIANRISQKARHELLAPRGRKNAAQKAASLKHDPYTEYRASPYILPDGQPALIGIPSSAFKGAMCTAALDLPNTKKAQIGRLVYVEGEYTPVYGKPYLHMAVVRSADINRTPDIRTRAILPRWACQVRISYVQPILTAQSVVNLLSAAGTTVGVGDWRPEKGKGNFGQFSVVSPDDPEFRDILTENRDVQIAAMESPDAYDSESAEMLQFWTSEARARGFAIDNDEDDDEEAEA